MPRAARFAHTVHIVALGIWLGALLMSGAAAAIIFPLARTLNLRLPEYNAYTGEHWTLAAGMIQSRLFAVADAVQFGACLLAIGTLAWSLFRGYSPGRALSVVRVLVLLLLMLSLIGQFFFMHPPMDLAMVNYWEAARAGDNGRAAEQREAFQKFHGPATAFMSFDAAAAFLALALGAWAGIAPAREKAP